MGCSIIEHRSVQYLFYPKIGEKSRDKYLKYRIDIEKHTLVSNPIENAIKMGVMSVKKWG